MSTELDTEEGVAPKPTAIFLLFTTLVPLPLQLSLMHFIRKQSWIHLSHPVIEPCRLYELRLMDIMVCWLPYGRCLSLIPPHAADQTQLQH